MEPCAETMSTEIGSVRVPRTELDDLAAAPLSLEAFRPGPGARAYRAMRDGWDVVRWTRHPIEFMRAVLPLPERWHNLLVLNEAATPMVESSPTSLSAALAMLRNLLHSEALIDGRVDYAGLPQSPAYAALREQSRLLTRLRPESFRSDAERTAFWLNLYNTLSIHGITALGLRRSAMEMPSFFIRIAYRVGEHLFCLDDISNGVLRRGATKPVTGRPQFRPDDPRMVYCPRIVDPRIHGALVCVAASCPPVAYYDPERLEDQLDLAAEHLVTQLVHLDRHRHEVRLPLQFYYYAPDFGGPSGIVRFLLRHLPEPDRATAAQAFTEGWRLRWDPYDWGLNNHVR